MTILINNNDRSKHVGIFQESLLLFCFLFPAGFAFFAIMLELSLPCTSTVKAASVLIIALIFNRIGRMTSAIIFIVPVFKKYDAIFVGIAQSLGLLFIMLGSLHTISTYFIVGAFFLGIGLAAGNVFFRTLLTCGISSINSMCYSILFYGFWGIGVAFAGLVWNFSFQYYIIPAMIVISLVGCVIAQRMFLELASDAENKKILLKWKETSQYLKIFVLSIPAVIVASVAILFNAALIPVLTQNFRFSVAETGIAACFIIIGNVFALFDITKKMTKIPSIVFRFSFTVIGNILLIISLFLLQDSKIFAIMLIIGIGWFSALSLNLQMDFVRINADKNMHRLIHMLSEILAVVVGIAFAFINKFGMSLSAQFFGIALVLILWWMTMIKKYPMEEQYG